MITLRSVNNFDVIPGDTASSVILHVPHSSTHIPADVRAQIALDDAELAAELQAITDADTDLVAERAAEAAGVTPWLFINRASRLVVDPERFPDEREELNARGMGAVYVSTTDQGILRTPTEEERQDLLDRFFHPYAEAFTQLVRNRLAATGHVTIIDIHSYPVVKLPYELNDGPRPEICIGTDDFHTPAALTDAARTAMLTAAPTGEIDLDSPFAGCYVPLDYYEKEAAVRGVMLEIRRDVVSGHLGALARATGQLIDAVESAGS